MGSSVTFEDDATGGTLTTRRLSDASPAVGGSFDVTLYDHKLTGKTMLHLKDPLIFKNDPYPMTSGKLILYFEGTV